MQALKVGSGWTFLILTVFSTFPEHCKASPTSSILLQQRPTGHKLPATPFFTFPSAYQPENIHPRESGQLLVTIDTAPVLYQVNPFLNQSGSIIHTFDNYTSLFGIVELAPDLFYVTAGNFTGPPDYYGFANGWSIFEVDLRGIPDPATAQSTVLTRISKVVDIPQAQLLDGLAIVNAPAGLLMTGDAQTGTLWLIDVHAGTAKAVLTDPLLSPTSTARIASLAHVGINGIKFHNGSLYWTNTAKGLYCNIALSNYTGTPVGNASVLADYGTLTDDFNFDRYGNQFISLPLLGVLLRPVGTSVAHNESRLLADLYGANSNAFGRTPLDRCILYSTFNGAPGGLAKIDAGKQGFCGEQEASSQRGVATA